MDKTVIEDKIWAFLDGSLTGEESEYVAAKVASDMAWQNCFKVLQFYHNELQQIELEAPSLRFTQSIMEQIAVHKIQPEFSKYINTKIIKVIGWSFILLLVFALLFSVIYLSRDTESTLSNPFESLAVSIDINAKAAHSTDSFSKLFLNNNLLIGLLSGLFLLASYFIGMLLRKKEKNIFS